jgi:hypothetical protein
VTPLALAVPTVDSPPVRMITEGEKRRLVGAGHEPDVAAPTAVTTVGATLGDVRL